MAESGTTVTDAENEPTQSDAEKGEILGISPASDAAESDAACSVFDILSDDNSITFGDLGKH